MLLPGSVEQLIHEYGPPGLFVLLALGIVGLPIPDETLLALSGYLVSTGQESYLPVALAAFSGSALGISLSFVIGHYPVHTLIMNYGHWIHLTEERYQKADAWFRKRGKLLLTFGYFIPGFRHISAIVAGASGMSFRTFVVYAWSGALLWTNTFLLLGYYAGEKWTMVLASLHKPVLWVLLIIPSILAAFYYIGYRNS